MNIKGTYINDYNNHANGHILIVWNEDNVEVRLIHSSAQLIHCSTRDLSGTFFFWCNSICGYNRVEQRRSMWEDILVCHQNLSGPWCLMGDFNNILKDKDIIGGRRVHENEYNDMVKMMDKFVLFKMGSLGDYYT